MKTMGKMGFHFRKHGHCGHKSARCDQTNKWSGWRACAGQGHGGKQQPSESMGHGPCHQHHGHGHHHHHHGFGKWGSKGMMRKFHHAHCAHMHHFHDHHQKHHGHTHPHCHQHGHERCSQHGMGRERMEKRHEQAHECCASRSQSKACQTEPIAEEAADCSDSQAIETEANQASA
ncbi:histidine-rich glycoprotein-like [Ischnura elegans]|uniref:histidine-rich glycoprotein-like n=1 Tax=Ischnura elegans TaxID=197161 RepID=UPI001ED86A76|nr:histidine-rich glycoprotein-like [Ischnura elegans]